MKANEIKLTVVPWSMGMLVEDLESMAADLNPNSFEYVTLKTAAAVLNDISGIDPERHAEICAAEKDGRVLVAPVKPFEKAYVPKPFSNEIMEVEISHYELCEMGCCGVIKGNGELRFDIAVIKATREAVEAAAERRSQ